MTFKYFHNEHDQHQILLSFDEIEKYDKRFSFLTDSKLKQTDAKVATDGRFVRYCISISKK